MGKVIELPYKKSVEVKPGFVLSVGDRVYNHGDMANRPAFGTIKDIVSGSSGRQILVEWDEKYNKKDSCLFPYGFSEKFLGHGGTRLVTEKAYREWRKRQLEQLERLCKK
jgi:hypothetical protein